MLQNIFLNLGHLVYQSSALLLHISDEVVVLVVQAIEGKPAAVILIPA